MRRILWVVLGLLLVVWAAPWVSNWWTFRSVATVPTWKVISPGIEFSQFGWSSGGGKKILVTAVRAPAAQIHVATGTATDAIQWRTREGAFAATNGGFFDENDASQGLRISGGVTRAPLRAADWGVFIVADGNARIVHTRDYTAIARRLNVSDAMQCGPRLVVSGVATRLKPQSARRTGIGIDATGRVVLAVADGDMLFSTWADVWASRSGLACPNALNLDGGPSTQMAIQTKVKALEVDGGQPVPDAVIVR